MRTEQGDFDECVDSFNSRFNMMVDLFESRREFADSAALGKKTTMAIQKKKIASPSFPLLHKIISNIGCSASWLMLGKGNAFSKDHPKFDELVESSKQNGTVDKLFPLLVYRTNKVQEEIRQAKSQKKFRDLVEQLSDMLHQWSSNFDDRQQIYQ